MNESYVSFETAKLLKEKGFDCPCICYYEDNGIMHEALDYVRQNDGEDDDNDECLCPTQQMACRWLREKHDILVAVQPCEVGPGVDDYICVIYEIQPEDYHFKFIAQSRMQPIAYTMDYEGTLEEGIKYVLNNLI